MDIRIEQDTTGYAPRAYRWSAWDNATYDGAEDSPNRHMVGHGETASQAIEDLLELMEDA